MTLVSLSAAQSPSGGPLTLPQQCPPVTRRSGKLQNVRAGDLLPNGFKVRGANLVPTIAAQASPNGAAGTPPTVWTETWQNWDWTWMNEMLDEAVYLGCNTVRFIGTVWGIYSGRITREQYFAKLDQLLDGCQKRGLYFYFGCVDCTVNDRFSDIPYSFVQQEVVAVAQHLHGKPDIIGLDLVTESGTTFALTANAVTLYNAVKAVTDLPTTYSTTEQPGGGTSTPTRFADRADFLDFHLYGAPSGFELDAYYAAGGGSRAIFFGEYGVDAGAVGIPAATARLISAASFISGRVPTGERRSAGGLMWAMRDINPTLGVTTYSVAFDQLNVERPEFSVGVKNVFRV